MNIIALGLGWTIITVVGSILGYIAVVGLAYFVRTIRLVIRYGLNEKGKKRPVRAILGHWWKSIGLANDVSYDGRHFPLWRPSYTEDSLRDDDE